MISPLLNIQNTYYRNGAEGLMSFCSDSFLHENGFRFFKARDYLAVTKYLDRKVAPLTDLAVHTDISVVLLNDRLCKGKPDADAVFI